MTVRTFGRAITLALVVSGVSSMAAAQSPASAPPPRDVMVEAVAELKLEVLAELKALRAEIRQASDATVRAQMLVGRLQLQEQRVGGLSRQLAETQQQMSENEKARAPLAAKVNFFSAQFEKASAEEREGGNLVVISMKNMLEQVEKRDRELKAQETYLLGQIADEQSRWASFNTLLDQLAATVGAPDGPAKGPVK